MSTLDKAQVYARKHYIKNKEAIRAKHRKYYQEHKEEIKAKSKAYRRTPAGIASKKKFQIVHRAEILQELREAHVKNKVARCKKSREWYQANKERAKKRIKEWAENNKDKVRMYAKNHIHRNRAANRQRCKRRRLLISVNGKFTHDEWMAIKSAHSFICQICKQAEPDIKLTIDHIIPLSKGGRHHRANIQPLCRSCNAKKGAKLNASTK